MFLPNSNSFLLVRSVKPVIQSVIPESDTSLPSSSSSDSRRKMFLTNSYFFSLVRSIKSIIQSSIQVSATSLSSPSSSSSSSDSRRKMFLPNSYSFSLVRSVKPVIQSVIPESVTSLSSSPTSDSRKKMFLPNSYSFSLRSVIPKPVIQSSIQESATSLPLSSSLDSERKTFLSNSNSFSLVSVKQVIQSGIQESTTSLLPPSFSSDFGKPTIGDIHKRTFLKVAGIAGASLIASLLLPKKAEALVLGSSPTTGVVGVKNAANTRINPATEETVSTLLKPSDLSFDGGALNVKVASLPSGSSSFSDSGNVARSGLVDVDRHLQVDVLSSALPASASTETTLQTISFGGYKFAFRLATVGSIDYVGEAAIGTATSAASWRIKKVDTSTGVIVQWAGTGVFDQVWDNYASLTYS